MSIVVGAEKRLLVCDLDNTLYDWVGYFVPALYAMVDVAVNLLGCDRDTLLDELRDVHQRHKDSEHPFALLETPTVLNSFPNLTRAELKRALDPAFHAFNVTRKETLRLYPGVQETLEKLRLTGIPLVAHTESKLTGVMDRLIRLGIADYFKRIYCRERPVTEHPDVEAGKRWLEKVPMHRVVELSHHQQKPSPDVLLEICQREGVSPMNCAYVGDSISRDIFMAKQARVFSIWAQYGAAKNEITYGKLVRVTHWSAEDVQREIQLRELSAGVTPDWILKESFSETLVPIKSLWKLAIS